MSTSLFGLSTTKDLPISPLYRLPIWKAVAVQAVVVALSLCALDFGFSSRLCGIAALGFWAGAALLIVRRPLAPTRFDLTFIRIGFLPLLALAIPLILGVWHLRGAL